MQRSHISLSKWLSQRKSWLPAKGMSALQLLSQIDEEFPVTAPSTIQLTNTFAAAAFIRQIPSNCFGLLKRAAYGQFHSVSEAHLHRYLPKPIQVTPAASRMRSAPPRGYAVPGTSDCYIASLIKPQTPRA
jgi:hypothetical protein